EPRLNAGRNAHGTRPERARNASGTPAGARDGTRAGTRAPAGPRLPSPPTLVTMPIPRAGGALPSRAPPHSIGGTSRGPLKMETVLTGITTTGAPHIGNYVGAIRPAIA